MGRIDSGRTWNIRWERLDGQSKIYVDYFRRVSKKFWVELLVVSKWNYIVCTVTKGPSREFSYITEIKNENLYTTFLTSIRDVK